MDKIESFGWTRSGQVALGSMAQVSIPQGWRFTGPQGTRDLLKMFDNVPGTSELGMLTTEGLGPWSFLSSRSLDTSKTMRRTSWTPMRC